MKRNKPKNANCDFWFIQCASCGAVVGVTDYEHVPSKIEDVAGALLNDIKSLLLNTAQK